jgi:hypothetical protein
MKPGPKREECPEGWTRERPPSYYIKQLEAQRRRRSKNPEKVKAIGRASEHRRRLKRYGVTEPWYADTLKNQKNLCDICLDPLVPGRTTHIDHNHKTGQVRGLLCSHCNFLIGNAKEDKFRLMQAINYLEKHDICGTS